MEPCWSVGRVDQVSNLPPPFVDLQKSIGASIRLVSATEALWISAPPASQLRQQLTAGQLEALYEAAYLRIFAAWESYLESTTVRLMAKKGTASYTPTCPPGTNLYRTLDLARAALFGGRNYLLWHNPQTVISRSAGVLSGSPVEMVLTANVQDISDMATVRHAIAHNSSDARRKFQAASQSLAGITTGNPGHFLRSPNVADPLNPMKWLLVLSRRLECYALQIAS